MAVEAHSRDPAVSFRAVVPGDFESICRLIGSEEELFLVYAQGRYPLTVAQVDALVTRRMEPTVMLMDGRVAGFGNFYGYRPGRSVFIGNVVVDAALRGRGLGRRLLTHLMNLALIDYQLRRVKVHVYNRNLGALLCYINLGFRPYAMKKKLDYAGRPVVMFSLEFRGTATGRREGSRREAAYAS